MNGTFRQSMSWLHTWAGLVLGWVLYFMFITGAIGYFNVEIDRWMRPEISIDKTMDQAQMLIVAEKRLAQVADNALSWFVDFPAGRDSSLRIWWKNSADEKTGKEGKWQDETLDLQTGQPFVVRETGGGNLLYRMHYVLHYIPASLAYWITSLSAMFMLVALISGIVIHKKIFKDFFTFRPGKRQRSWLDMHNVLSVLPLPFHLMITYSGLIFLMFTTMPGVMNASYGFGEENRDRFFDEAFNRDHTEETEEKIAADGVALSSIFGKVEQRWGKNQLHWIGVEGRGNINAHIEVSRQGYTGLSGGEELTYDGVTGVLHEESDDENNSGAKQFRNVMTSLHEGKFAGIFLRWIYFISSLMGAGMIATGMILWAGKRRLKAEKLGASKGLVLVEYLNVGTIVGLPIAIAAYFWANRLLPTSFEGRADWEVHILFINWALMLLYPVLMAKKRSLNQAWIDQLLLAAAAFFLLPLLNLLMTDQHLGSSLIQHDWVMAGFDLSMFGIGLCFYYAVHKMRNKKIILSKEKEKEKEKEASMFKQTNSTDSQVSKA